MNNNNILEKFRTNVAIYNFKKEYADNHTLKQEINWRIYRMKKRLVACVSLVLVLISGVVFAKNYNRIIESFGLGKEIETAIDNGYIAIPNMAFETSSTTISNKAQGITLEDINVNTKIDDFLMDDLNISTHFTFEINNKINEVFDLDKLDHIELIDLIVTDEKNKILYCANKETFEEFCRAESLNYEFSEFNENYYNCGLNCFMTRHYKQTRSISFTYNMYSSGEKNFPKSKKLNFKFKNIEMRAKENDIVNLIGNWNIELDVPEKMYNRKSIAYKVVSCENSEFQITNATLKDTGFELGIIISNIERAIEPQILADLRKKEFKGEITNEEANRIRNTEKEYIDAKEKWTKESFPITTFERNKLFENSNIENVTYVENEKGEKFKTSTSASRKQDANFIDDNRFSFYETFELTSYNATDKLKVRVIYKDNPYIIELEKANK